VKIDYAGISWKSAAGSGFGFARKEKASWAINIRVRNCNVMREQSMS
jgi:hypothetical protein